MRSAPVDGYDFGRKRQYRRDVWAACARSAAVPLRDARCLLLPSSEGAEIEVALNNGAREENLIVVDQNPAIVAHLKRRFPRVTGFGVSVDRAATKLVTCGERVDVANLDLCGYLHDRMARAVWYVIRSGVLAPRAVCGLTWVRGRERDRWWQLIQETGRVACWERVVSFASEEGYGARSLVRLVRASQYKSSLPMEWGVWQVWDYREIEWAMTVINLILNVVSRAADDLRLVQNPESVRPSFYRIVTDVNQLLARSDYAQPNWARDVDRWLSGLGVPWRAVDRLSGQMQAMGSVSYPSVRVAAGVRG